MKKIIRLTESDLVRIVRRVIKEEINFNVDDPEFGREEKKEYYSDQADINGVNIQVYYDEDYQNYVLYFPNIKFGHDDDVSDQVIRISDSKDDAKFYFNRAKKMAEKGYDEYDIFKYIELIKNR